MVNSSIMIQLSVNDAPRKLREIRKWSRIGQRELCNMLYKSRNYISLIENGKADVGSWLLHNYLYIFDVEGFRIGDYGKIFYDYVGFPEKKTNIFKQIRKQYKASQIEVGFRLNYCQSLISWLESEKLIQKLRHLEEYSKVFGCTIEIRRSK